MRPGVTDAQARADLAPILTAGDRVVAADPNTRGQSVSLLGVQRPAQIVNYRTVGAAPVVLAVALAVGAIVALALTLTASVRRRRRDLALLKTLGFTRRQLAATVASQATVAALIGIAVGVPVGVIAGRWLWTEFAREIAAVPSPTVPAGWILLVAIATLTLANLVGLLPGWQAARTPSGVLLQAE
jgi:ABC-type lipoprotein release transport system permease subunit